MMNDLGHVVSPRVPFMCITFTARARLPSPSSSPIYLNAQYWNITLSLAESSPIHETLTSTSQLPEELCKDGLHGAPA